MNPGHSAVVTSVLSWLFWEEQLSVQIHDGANGVTYNLDGLKTYLRNLVCLEQDLALPHHRWELLKSRSGKAGNRQSGCWQDYERQRRWSVRTLVHPCERILRR